MKIMKIFSTEIFENPFNKDKYVGPLKNTRHKKVLKFVLNAELAKLKFTYVTVVKYVAKARPR